MENLEPEMFGVSGDMFFEDAFADEATSTHVVVYSNFKVEVDFTWLHNTYTFPITRWMGTRMQKSLLLFHQHTSREEATYGSVTTDGSVQTTADQKRNIFKQTIRDLVSAIKLIISEYKTSLLDYAMWYRDIRPGGSSLDTYSELITHMACECIIHGGVLANLNWKLVEWR